MAGCKDKCKSRGVTWCLIAMSSFALLIWAKLRLVTGVPRTAYAHPERNDSVSPKPGANPAGTDGSGETDHRMP